MDRPSRVPGCVRLCTEFFAAGWLTRAGAAFWMGAALWCALSLAAKAQGADLAAASNTVVAQRLAAGERIRLDGRLDHPAWQRAAPFSHFVERAPDTGAVPGHATELRVLFDDQALYVGVRCLDPAPEHIRAPLVRHDGVNRTQDFVVAYIDAIGRGQSAQFFRVNAAGAMGDGMHTASDDSEDFAPDFDWDAAAHQNDQGWTAVMRIPFASLRFTQQHDGPWRFMLARRVPREQVYLYSSVLIPRDAPSFIHTMQPLVGVVLPQAHQFLSLRPSLTWRQTHDVAATGPSLSRTTWDAALDIKWRPRPELVVDATLNPDFSQVALDEPQLQGNRLFALQLQEKRPFFFEASDLLRSPTEALYSRSITDPRWGLRGTWRDAELAGTAFVAQDRGGGLVLLPDAYQTAYAVQPAAQVLAARLRGDAGPLQWGALATARHYDQGRGHNKVLGADLGWQINGAWRLRAQWLQSHTTALPQPQPQPQPQRLLALGPAMEGHRAFAKLWFQTPQREAELWLDDIGSGFRNDQGFTYQRGVRRLGGRLGQGWQALGPFNDFWLNFEGTTTTDRQQGQLISNDWHPSVWMTGAHNLEAWVHWVPSHAQRMAADQPLLHENYLRAGAVFTPAPWVPLFKLEGRLGRLVDVQARELRDGGDWTLSLTARPLAMLELEPKLSVQWLRHQGQQVYLETSHQLVARWFVDANHSLRAIVQRRSQHRLAEPANAQHAGITASDSASTVGSLTWTWRQSAGTLFHLGATHQRAQGGPQRGTELFVKLQLDMDEVRRRWR